MPSKATRYAFKQVSPDTRVRLGFKGSKTVEITPYHKKGMKYVKGHRREL